MENTQTKPVTICMNVDVQVPITYNDILAWLVECDDPNTLRTVSIMANRFANQLYAAEGR